MRKILSKISQTPADPDKPRHEGVLFIEGVPDQTMRLFNSKCARRELTQRDALIRFMWMYINTPSMHGKQSTPDTSSPSGRGAMLIEGIPMDTKTAFKSACKLRKESMKDVILKFMWQFGKGTFKLR